MRTDLDVARVSGLGLGAALDRPRTTTSKMRAATRVSRQMGEVKFTDGCIANARLVRPLLLENGLLDVILHPTTWEGGRCFGGFFGVPLGHGQILGVAVRWANGRLEFWDRISDHDHWRGCSLGCREFNDLVDVRGALSSPIY